MKHTINLQRNSVSQVIQPLVVYIGQIIEQQLYYCSKKERKQAKHSLKTLGHGSLGGPLGNLLLVSLAHQRFIDPHQVGGSSIDGVKDG